MSAYYRLRERHINEQGVAIAHYEPTEHAQGVVSALKSASFKPTYTASH